MDDNDNFRNTDMCYYGPQLCYNADNVSFVGKEGIGLCKQAAQVLSGAAAAAAAAAVTSSYPPHGQPNVVLPDSEVNDICDNAAIKSASSTDLVVPVCEESASIFISSEPSLCEVTSTCLNVRYGCKLVSQRYCSSSEVYSAAAGGGTACRFTNHPPPPPHQ